ncbi:MAG TPA: DUF6527 family protein, partial [Bacteroidales bacterium]|nr:DUF6527 family protein [Bacteroidales bacterium]
SPSIGNWSFNCQSHYWIKRNKIVYAREWDKEEIQFGRTNDEKRKAKYYNKENESVSSVTKRPKKKKRWKKFLKSIFSF